MISTTPQPFNTQNGLAGFRMGKGPDLVLLHGVGLCSEFWIRLCEDMREEFTLHAIDLPGHGQSDSLNVETPSLQDYSNSVAEYLKSFKHPVYLVGHSMGAMMALDITIRFPKLIKSVAALNAVYTRSEKAAQAVQARAAALKTLTQDRLNTDVTLERWFGLNPTGTMLKAAQACKSWLHATPIKDYQQAYEIFAYHDGPSVNALKGLKKPSLFLTGENEPNSTPDMSRAMGRIAPMGTTQIIPGAAHMMPMTHSAQVAAALKNQFKG